MGYRSDFTISASIPGFVISMDNFAGRLSKISGYTMHANNTGTIEASEIKWYDAEEGIGKLSEENPTIRFTIHARGESGEEAMIYALGGMTERCNSLPLTFPERTLWSDAK